jgi:hypothetical protein
MSNPLAIAAVTAAIRFLLERAVGQDQALGGTSITTKPPDKARGTNTNKQLNLFMYQTQPNAALRNSEIPQLAKRGESGTVPLALNLFYLITAYGDEQREDEEVIGHHLLGRAMSVLHDHCLLGTDEIRNAYPGNDLYQQIERVRITLEHTTIDEISKLCTAFQTPYRLSSFYHVSVVLIDSGRELRSPLPVLMRGPKDQGWESHTSLIPPYPAIDELELPPRQNSIRLGETVKIKGHDLDGVTGIRFSNPNLTTPLILAPTVGATASEITVGIQNPAGQAVEFVAGIYSLAVIVHRPNEPDERTTNEVPVLLAPRITSLSPSPPPFGRDATGTVTITLMCEPRVLPEQRVSVLIGDRAIVANPHPTLTDSLSFTLPNAVPGKYFVRLRVDGVDSLLIDQSTTIPVFDPSQVVTIT